ncbi:MAG: charged multivesicular body protein 4 [Promethearchaeota archaeon CR_4]|nr:MAG: charged multivesicular body protein 4 [Candidatus Lokiarchaeota archaeon CR_4]
MVARKLFPRKGQEKEKIQAELKATINRIELKSRQFRQKANVMRVNAKKALKVGDKEGARNLLVRWKKYKTNLDRYQNIVGRIERHLEALEQASMIKDVGNVMGKSAKTLEKISTNISPEKAMEISEGAEESISKIEEAGELLGGDLETDFGLDIEEEMNRLEADLLLEDAGGIPTAPLSEGGESIEEIEEEPVDQIDDKEKLKKEMEKLKKELES